MTEYTIPKGSFVIPFLSAVHCDENLYKGANAFNPWRWMDPENQVRTLAALHEEKNTIRLRT